ncbi:hypothetical protein TWF281_000826 [Arthrobotrys megalospora]
MSSLGKWESVSDYTLEEQDLLAGILRDKAVSDHVTAIKELDLRRSALDLQNNLDWMDELQNENEQLYDENGKLEEKILDLRKQLAANNGVAALDELENLHVELRNAHILIKGMLVKHRELETRFEAERRARTTGPGGT